MTDIREAIPRRPEAVEKMNIMQNVCGVSNTNKNKLSERSKKVKNGESHNVIKLQFLLVSKKIIIFFFFEVRGHH